MLRGKAMDFTTILDLIKNTDTDQIFAYLKSINMMEIMRDPRVLIGIGVFAVIALIMRWRLLLATLLSVAGFAALINYTVDKGTKLENLGSENLMIFVGIGVMIVFAGIYLIFIKSE